MRLGIRPGRAAWASIGPPGLALTRQARADRCTQAGRHREIGSDRVSCRVGNMEGDQQQDDWRVAAWAIVSR
jgi:hypothetical protein